jgi:hypothetical protein
MLVHVPVTTGPRRLFLLWNGCDSDACQTGAFKVGIDRHQRLIASPDAAESVSHILTHFVGQGKRQGEDLLDDH